MSWTFREITKVIGRSFVSLTDSASTPSAASLDGPNLRYLFCYAPVSRRRNIEMAEAGHTQFRFHDNQDALPSTGDDSLGLHCCVKEYYS